MFDTLAVLTLTLAKAFGVYLIAVGLTGLTSPQRFIDIIADLRRSPALVYVTAVFTFAIGLTLIIVHTYWTDVLAIVVSLVGWIALVEGVLMLAVPDAMLKLGASILATPRQTRVIFLVTLVLGAALLGIGIVSHAEVGL